MAARVTRRSFKCRKPGGKRLRHDNQLSRPETMMPITEFEPLIRMPRWNRTKFRELSTFIQPV
jgi:hypothetical protein